MFTKKQSFGSKNPDELKNDRKKASQGVEESIFMMLKKEGLITENEYAKCILAFKKS
jgi:uncharacterized membrane protein YqiK